MGSYRVTSAPSHSIPWVAVGAALGVVFALLAATAPALSTISVTVDGSEIRLPAGSSAKSVLASGAVMSKAGDMLDVNGHLLIEGAGEPYTVWRGDERLAETERVFDGDILFSRYGTDTLEGTSTVTTATPPPVIYEGKGPLEGIETTGTPGTDEMVVGSLSGEIVSRRTLTEPEPMVVRRWTPNRTDRVVALTFDDGPWPGQTEDILRILEDHNVKATFFLLGSLSKKYPELARKVAEAGHQIGNHSYSHANLSKARNGTLEREIKNGQRAIQKATGVTPTWFRAPGGNLSSSAAKAVREADLRVVTWSVDPQDWRRPKWRTLARAVMRDVEPGSIVLLHDGGGDRSATIRALPRIIRKLQKEGYAFVTLDELGEARRR